MLLQEVEQATPEIPAIPVELVGREIQATPATMGLAELAVVLV
jgi:hypothetical protein